NKLLKPRPQISLSKWKFSPLPAALLEVVPGNFSVDIGHQPLFRIEIARNSVFLHRRGVVAAPKRQLGIGGAQCGVAILANREMDIPPCHECEDRTLERRILQQLERLSSVTS